jgi:hypothetical protein
MMKKIITSLILIASFAVNINAKHYQIHIGAKASDGSGLGTPIGDVTWGGSCTAATGICIIEVPKIMQDGSALEDLIINKEGEVKITISNSENIKNLHKMLVGDILRLDDNVAIYAQNLQSDFPFLEKGAKYFIPKGKYQTTLQEDGTILLIFKLEKI